MIFFSALIISILDFCKRKSRFIFTISALFLWSILAFTYGAADESIYISRYTNPELWAGKTEVLYALSMTIASKVGLTFYQYKAIITGVELLLICSTIKKMAKYPNVVLLCYMVVPFALNVVQMRHALASAIFIYFSRYLFENENSDKIIKVGKYGKFYYADLMFAIGILLASLVHVASFIWLVLLIAKKCDIRTCCVFMILTNLLLQFVVTPRNIAKIIRIISKRVTSRMIAYLTIEYQNSVWRHRSQILYVFIIGMLMCGTYCFIIKRKQSFNVSNNTITALKLNICILIILSLMIKYTQELYRLQEGLFIINYITITNVIKDRKINSTKISVRSLGVMSLLIIYVAFSAWFLIYHYLIPSVVVPILNNNYLLNFLK